MVDGQRLNDPAISGAGETVPKYPLINIARVELIRGPGAAVYGSNAMLGVINIITRREINKVTASVGSLNRRKLSILASHSTDDVKIDFFGHFDADNGDHYRVQDTFSSDLITTDDPRELADFSLKFKWKQTQVNLQHNQYKADNFYELDSISNDFNARSSQLTSISLQHNVNWQAVSSWFWLSYNRSKFNTKSQLTAPGDLTTG